MDTSVGRTAVLRLTVIRGVTHLDDARIAADIRTLPGLFRPAVRCGGRLPALLSDRGVFDRSGGLGLAGGGRWLRRPGRLQPDYHRESAYPLASGHARARTPRTGGG